jgi:hypothetical protein
MIRIVAENVLLFLLPTFLYVAYVLVTRRPAGSPGADGTVGAQARRGVLDDAPLLYLLAAGALLVVSTLVFFATNTGGSPDKAYHPPVFKDGRLEPGRIE